ncbi:MAG: hypothetical protein IJX99_08885 [Clostridia bacterium]|nr:hypothetical protein [Clostridia bacterium]
MDSERALRELRKSIEELTETFNDTLARKNGRLRDFDINSTGYEDRAMLRRLQDYGINPSNPNDLNQMIRNLNDVIRDLREKRDDLEEAIARRRDKRPILRGIRSTMEGLDVSANISEEERDARRDSYNNARLSAARSNNPDILIRNINRQLREFVFDRKAALAMSVIMQNPELRENYINLMDMENKLEEEEQYRDDQRRLTGKYNELCKAYMLLEKVERGMENPNLTPQHQLVMERDREDAIQKIEDAMQDPADDARRKNVLGNRAPGDTVDIKKVMPKLREEIEQVAFERNALNGIVDDRVLQRDKFAVERVDLQQKLKDSYAEPDAKKRADKQKELAKTKELKEYLELLEIKNMINTLNTKTSELQAAEAELTRLQGLVPSPFDANNPDHVAKRDAANKKLADVNKLKGEVAKLKKDIFDKVSPLKMKGLTKLQLSELDDPAKLVKVGDGLDSRIKSAEKDAADRRKKALAKYDVKERKGDKTKDLFTKVDTKVASIRSRYNGRHALQTLNGQEQAARDAADGNATPNPVDVNAPQVNPVGPGASGNPTRTTGGVVPPLFGNPGGASSNPGVRVTQPRMSGGLGGPNPAPVNPVAPTSANPGPAPADVSAPQTTDEYRPADYKYRYLGYQKKLGEVPVQYDLQSQLDELGQQRVEAGKVYRYEKAGDRLIYLEEDLSIYVTNPKAKLNDVLDGLRAKLEEEFNDKGKLKEFLAQDGKEELKDLISKNPLVRMRARKEFMDALESTGGPMQLANMAIALNSEATPEMINEVLGRKAQPYTRDSDMHKYVKMKEKRGFLGIGSVAKGKVDQPRIMQIANKIEKAEARGNRSSLQIRTQTDGMLRPFEISDEEIGGKRERSQDPNRNPQRGGRGSRHSGGPGGRS